MRRAIDIWVNRPSVDFAFVIAAAGLLALFGPYNVPGVESLDTWYQTLASVTGVLLGLGGLALTVVFAVAPTDRLSHVYRSTGPRLAKLVLSSLGGLAAATAGFVALFLVSATATSVRNGLTAALVVLSALRFARLWWIFRRVLAALMVRDAKAGQSETERASWDRPVVGGDHYRLPTRVPD